MSQAVSEDEIETGSGAAETASEDGWQRVSKLSMVVQLVAIGFRAIIPASFLLWSAAADSDGDAAGVVIPIITSVILLIIAVIGLATWLGWLRFRYRIGENDIRVEQGVISRQARSVPYERIQDVSLEQKIIPRLLGLVQVKFETGAGGKEELSLAYVKEADGERLRETVRALVDGEIAQTLPAHAPDGDTSAASAPAIQSEGKVLFAMGPRRLFTFGMFSFSLVVFGVLMGLAQQFDIFLSFDWWDYVVPQFEDERIDQAGGYISSFDTTARILAVLYAIGTVIVVGMVSGVVTTLVRDWEFLLERSAKGFRRRRGLLTKTDVVMPVHRVQALIVKTGILRRRFGWHGLSFVSLAQDAKSANHSVAPFAKMEEITPIAAEAGFTLPEEAQEWRRPSPSYYMVRAVLSALLAGAHAVAAILVGYPIIGLALFFIALILIARQFYLWRFDRHALDPAQVLSLQGWLSPRLKVANRVKLHSVEIAQGPLGRWRGYCSLRFGLAGGHFSFDGLTLENARELRAAVLNSIAEVDFAKLPR